MILLLILLYIQRLPVAIVKFKGMLQTVFDCCHVIDCPLANINDCHCWGLGSISLNLNFNNVLKGMRFSVPGKSDIAVLEQLPIQLE